MGKVKAIKEVRIKEVRIIGGFSKHLDPQERRFVCGLSVKNQEIS